MHLALGDGIRQVNLLYHLPVVSSSIEQCLVCELHHEQLACLREQYGCLYAYHPDVLVALHYLLDACHRQLHVLERLKVVLCQHVYLLLHPCHLLPEALRDLRPVPVHLRLLLPLEPPRTQVVGIPLMMVISVRFHMLIGGMQEVLPFPPLSFDAREEVLLLDGVWPLSQVGRSWA
jgi:hypothetical protein